MSALDFRFHRQLIALIEAQEHDMLMKLRQGLPKTEREMGVYAGWFRAIDSVKDMAARVSKDIEAGN